MYMNQEHIRVIHLNSQHPSPTTQLKAAEHMAPLATAPNGARPGRPCPPRPSPPPQPASMAPQSKITAAQQASPPPPMPELQAALGSIAATPTWLSVPPCFYA
ncbi:hypothetical protein PVAP13_4KG166800 [Panicum virgatum]|uniref:Uncharacterized protein n=1 Tax=Panicum virgatum TaxID=38727 RepID=A0A8T0TS02_PANVG|nr:hypothetical protein PVAP13_4KG166800 [Panicum virgatum]